MAFDCTVILGPTAVGKSGVIYGNFSKAPLHLISADSMQIYRHFNVATATPSDKQLNSFPHTGINEIDPDESFSVSKFLKMSNTALERATTNGRHPLILGGTALYIKTFLYGLDEMPEKNPEYRKKLRETVNNKSSEYLYERLRAVDPRSAEEIHPNDTRRIIRALEIFNETGRTKSQLQSKNTLRDTIEPTVIGLRRPREELEDRLTSRVERMVINGLIREVKQLKKQWTVSETLKQAIGLRSVSDYLDGKIDKDEMKAIMIDRTRRLVKKQETWFKRFPVDCWFHPENDHEELIATIGNQFN